MLHDSVAPSLFLFINNTLVPLKLLQKGYSFVHAACLDHTGEGLLIVAPPNTGKTYTALSLNRAGFNFLSDDLTIIKGNKAYCWPTNLTINPFHIDTFELSISWREYLKMTARQMINRVPLLAACLDGVKMSTERVLHNLIAQTTIKNMCFLDNGPEVVEELDHKVGFKKLIATSHEIQVFGNPIISYYFYKYPREKVDFPVLLNLRNKIYEDLTKRARIFSVMSNKGEYPRLILDNIYKR